MSPNASQMVRGPFGSVICLGAGAHHAGLKGSHGALDTTRTGALQHCTTGITTIADGRSKQAWSPTKLEKLHMQYYSCKPISEHACWGVQEFPVLYVQYRERWVKWMRNTFYED